MGKKYQTRTQKAGLQRMIDTFVTDIPVWIDVPDSVKEIFRHPDVVQVLLGEREEETCYECGHEAVCLSEEEEVKLAIKVCNAADILLAPVMKSGEMDPYSDKIQQNVFNFLMLCRTSVAWLALRNTWGPENINQGKNGLKSEFLRFASTYWIDVFIKIKRSKVWKEA